MSKVRKAEWDIISNGTKRRIDIMSKVIKPIGTKCRMVPKKVESKQCRMRNTMSKRVKNVESKEMYSI
jgi:hypothetical protein